VKTLNLPGEAVCQQCGLRTKPDEPACAAKWDLLLARDYERAVLFGRFHRMAVDAYCLQHAPYVESGKSLAAHLCGLCIAFEHGNDVEVFRQLQQWLSGNLRLVKPDLPLFRGSVTIGDVYGISDPIEFGRAVEAWARSAWEAYRELQPQAREWLALSNSQRS
jgi:Family of unknown function (DUF5946)